jgi:galactokinase
MGSALQDEARRLLTHLGAEARAVAEAPGRVNLIGEYTDYNGGLVLPAALAQRTAVAVRFGARAEVRGVSREEGSAEAGYSDPPRGGWLDYVRGVARELSAAGRIPRQGFDIAVAGDVPGGSGLSSSAALEVASALALAAAAGGPFRAGEALELAALCQRAESQFVGVPCGILDPFASLLAQADHVTLLDCARMDFERVPFPSDLALLIVDTGVRRALREGAYAERHRECEQALEASRSRLGRQIGSLSELRLEELPTLRATLPLRELRRVRHVLTENDRVRDFVRALADRDWRSAGEALYRSHASLRDDYSVTCAESDLLVDQSRTLPGVVGARMTGAGWGGCTVHLAQAAHAEKALETLRDRFAARFERIPRAWQMRPGRGAEVST